MQPKHSNQRRQLPNKQGEAAHAHPKQRAQQQQQQQHHHHQQPFVEYYTHENDLDFPLKRVSYCSFFLRGKNNCKYGDQCKNRHITYAQLRREVKSIHPPYKKHLCKKFEQNGQCDKDKFFCLFAHGEDDIWGNRGNERAASEINSDQVDMKVVKKLHAQLQKQQRKAEPDYEKVMQQKFSRAMAKKAQAQREEAEVDVDFALALQSYGDDEEIQHILLAELQGAARGKQRGEKKNKSKKPQQQQQQIEASVPVQKNRFKQLQQKESAENNDEEWEDVDECTDSDEEVQNAGKKSSGAAQSGKQVRFDKDAARRRPDKRKQASDSSDDNDGKKNNNNNDDIEDDDEQDEQQEQVQARADRAGARTGDKKGQKSVQNANANTNTNAFAVEKRSISKKDSNRNNRRSGDNNDEDGNDQDSDNNQRQQVEETKHEFREIHVQPPKPRQAGQGRASSGGTAKLDIPPRIDIFAFFFYHSAAGASTAVQNWRRDLSEILKEHAIPEQFVAKAEPVQYQNNALHFQVRLTTLHDYGVKLLRVHLVKKDAFNAMFFLMPFTECQIVFSNKIKEARALSSISFESDKGEICYVYNSKLDRQESSDTEYKLFDLRKTHDNTRTLEKVILAMLNKDSNFSTDGAPQSPYVGHVIMGVRDDTRIIEGTYGQNNVQEHFFSFLMRRLNDTTPPSGVYVERKEYRVVVPNEDRTEFYPILDNKVYVLSIKRPKKPTLFMTSDGMYYQRVEEGVWPIGSAALFEKYKQGLVEEAHLRQGLRQYDRRYFYVISKRIEGLNEIDEEGANDKKW